MQRKLYVIDYSENGEDKYHVVDAVGIGCLTDSEMVQMLHFIIGKRNKISMVTEVITDASLEEFTEMCDTGLHITMPHRILYVDMNEIIK